MAQWQVDLEVWLKPSVFDPQGHAVLQALQSLGHSGVSQVRVGKSMAIAMTGDTRQAVEKEVRKMCDTVLCNGVMETYEIVRIEPAGSDAGSGAETTPGAEHNDASPNGASPNGAAANATAANATAANDGTAVAANSTGTAGAEGSR